MLRIQKIFDGMYISGFYCNETESYSSEFAGYGKTTEIKYKVKERNGKYYYLPLGGVFTRNYVINNLENLNLELKDGKEIFIHLDLSETENDDLMNEILFKLLILRFIDSNDKIFYLGNDVNIIIEIPNDFIDFKSKYSLLILFKNIHIDKLCPLRLEENIKKVEDSPISIVAETLKLYDDNEIEKKNIKLEQDIKLKANECEQIINKHFNEENHNYYQKINFIKILAIQFKKFCKNMYFSYEIASACGKADIICDIRKSFIKNFIALTKVFARSPYDSILIRKNASAKLFDKSQEKKIKEDALISLSSEMKEVFSFKLIKPSLVFFNRDGFSLSIITNIENKDDPEYKELYKLWNSQNFNPEDDSDLIDYKSLSHEKFIKEIQILFSLHNNMEEEDIKEICEKNGNYIFVSDNYIKMVRILLNIEAKIPVILMGETGVGKTKLLEILATLYGKGKAKWKTLQIHAGINDKNIVDFIDEVNNEVNEKEKEEAEENKKEDKKELTWIFLDEINTCNSLGLITEIMCNHTYLGKKISENIIFIGACNPYRLLTKKMRESGLVYYNMKEDNKLNNLVYTVNPLPHSLLNFVFDFGSLRKEDEEKYILNTIYEKLSIFKQNHLIDNINETKLKEIAEKIKNSIVTCHDFIRDKYDESSVSMREIRRFGLLFEYFIKNYDAENKIQFSLNMALYLCYYLRINDKKHRQDLEKKLNKFSQNEDFLKTPETQVEYITKQMYIEKSKGIALNRALRENLFTIFICITNKIPLIIVGKPGTSKSLSFQIVYNTMKGKYSEKAFFKDKGKLYRYYYQGSETSTAEGIEQVFDKAKKAQDNNKDNDIINLVFFDEMGLAERSSNNPLKVIHYLLERDQEDSVPFLGISNWKLDASKINRALNLSITDYDINDLKETAISIAKAINSELAYKYTELLESLTETYNDYIINNRRDAQENRDFHGNRDFYTLIKNTMREIIKKRKVLEKQEKNKKVLKNLLTRIGIECLERNFDGLDDSIYKIKNIFKEKYKTEGINMGANNSKLETIIEKNLTDSNSRYLMIISEGNDGSDIIKYLMESKNKENEGSTEKKKYNYIELVGSKYIKDIKSGKYSEEILNKIKYLMETESILILKDLDMIYASLYDLFNQNFTCMGDKQFARIAFEYSKISSEVNKDFHAIIIVDNNKIQELKLDPPFLNRFEKHLINFRMLIEEKDKEIARKISDYIAIISSYNNNENLKLDLGKLLINCEQHNIEGLIYKIEKQKETSEIPENIETMKYEKLLFEKIFKIIVPTFCQDIIASIFSSNYEAKYHLMNEIVIKTYQNCSYPNFKSFFEKIDKKKNIIYTFSKLNENIIDEEQTIKNKFGFYNKSKLRTVTFESIKSENELINLLKEFFNSNDKQLLILAFEENDLYKVNYANYIINNFEKENINKYKDKKEKLIMFIIHMQRHKKSLDNKKINRDLITFFNDEYYQIFIDNLNGKEDMNFCEIISNETDNFTLSFNKYINEEFLDKNIYKILSYLNYKILYQTEDLNSENFLSQIKDKIKNNKKLKKLILKNLREQGKSIKDIINLVFTSELNEEFEVDFIEVIDNKLSANFNLFLLNIIYYILNKNILIPILNGENLDKLQKDYYFESLINSEFDNVSFNFDPQLKLEIKANMISIYNGLSIPQSKIYLDKIINYINEQICPNYIENEELMRKNNIKSEEISAFSEMLERFERNIKFEINKNELIRNIQNNNDLKSLLLEDYLKYFIIILFEKEEIDYKYNESVYNFLKIILKVKLGENTNYNFSNTIDEFIKIILFVQGYKNDIKNIFNTFIDVKEFDKNIEEKIINILNGNIIKYEISERNKEYTKKVNISFFNIIESLSRAILSSSVDLIKTDKNKFHEYFKIFTLIEANLQKFNNKFHLYSKELGNLATIIKMQESYKYKNNEQFINNYEKIIKNLLEQSKFLYNSDYNNCYSNILNLNKILDETFTQKGEEYSNLLIFIFRLQYKLICDDEIKIKLIESFFKNPLLIKKSKLFLSETLKDMKPEVINATENKTVLINNFMNLEDNQKLFKYKNLINQYNSINSKEFNELLLFTFENQCQSYFISILKNNNNVYTEKTCNELLLDVSLEYLKKAINYLYKYYVNNNMNVNVNDINNNVDNNTNNNDVANNNNLNININNIINREKNNLLKLYAIAYIKTYYYYYVEINYNHFNKCKFDKINDLFKLKDGSNNTVKNIINIYIWRLYYKKFKNFEEFKNFNFSSKKIPIYKELKDELSKQTNNNPQNIKNLIECNYEPSTYPQDKYPNIQYFYTPIIQDMNSFVQKFNSCTENKSKYILINLLINEKNDLTENAILVNNLNNINKFANLLLNIYSYKISRDDAKKRKLSDELPFIMNSYNKMYNSSINDKKVFENKYINPFINSWKQIKDKLFKYNEKIIVDKSRGEKPLEIKINNPISNFLVDDDDDKDGGLFLASAYENMIEWQNQFLDEIISKNNTNGILNSYIYQLEKEINIQDATEDEIININGNTKKIFYDLILSSSMRNIFDDKSDKINYKNYNDIIYDYDLIEEELGKIILPGLKKFKKDKIKFVTFLYEGFRRGNSNVLIEYSNKYKQRELNEVERNCIDALKQNKNYRLYNDIFSSLQILMNEIIKNNYDQNYLLYDIVKKLPKYIILNDDITKLMENNYNNKSCFTINSLVSFFEYFEDLCWNQIKKHIPSNYKLEMNSNDKQYILDYFNSQSKKINKKHFTTALRKLISRSIAGSHQDIDMKSDLKLKMYIKREDLWNRILLKSKMFNQEIDKIFKNDILVGHCWNLYNLLEGENNTLEEMQQGH